ncbi:fatty acid desaturase [Cohnella nanjingensis]|uniref:Fatty acid desaturase n=1 Tax=Cohnella nanjingensis TaxID=1387779 RepID=A0A7X0RRK3_9BACL|nr:fatty acid desaturase [Cohnella nanjingensis]MBB6671221.1 fatty acid desaturase [Cohnella nanjingensis]
MPNKEQDRWRSDIAPYERSQFKRSLWQLANTLVPFIGLWFAAYWSLSVSYWLTLAIAIPAGGFLVRIFIIFHDCCHRSFFRSKRANAILGTITGILTLSPYAQWRHTHSIHHATSSNLDRRGVGDIWTLTVEEYLSASRTRRLAYRIYRNPVVMFVLGPVYIFLIDYRFNRRRASRSERLNTYITNAGILALAGLLSWAIGWQAYLLVQLPIFLLSGMAGIWLFYVQHTFEDSYFEQEAEWNYVSAAVHGSSYYKLPKVLHWITGNIGYHHVHHLSPRVPNYHLEKVHNGTPMLQKVQTITLLTSLKSLRFRLWHEHGKKFIGFKELRQLALPRSKSSSSL